MQSDQVSTRLNLEGSFSRVLIAGLGDLGKRIAVGLLSSSAFRCDLHLVARNEADGSRFVNRLAEAGQSSKLHRCDIANGQAFTELLASVRPNIVVHAASMLSPWYLGGRRDKVAQRICMAGFAIQLPAQLPLLMQTMEAIRRSGLKPFVVNCSYPDVTHPILAQLGLSPQIGIGNAGIILSLLRRRLTPEGAQFLRVVAHHAHVRPFITGARDSDSLKEVRVYNHNATVPFEHWYICLKRRGYTKRVNAFSAWHAIRIIRALCLETDGFHTSAPGVGGLPGGWPVVISRQNVRLDLPCGEHIAVLIELNQTSARNDGIESIGKDGCVHFTDDAKEILQSLAPELSAPLHPYECKERFGVLKSLLNLPG